MVTRFKDVTGTPIMLGDLVEVHTPTYGYIGEVVFQKDFGQIAVKVMHRSTQMHPERWEDHPHTHDTYIYLNSYRHKVLGLFTTNRLKQVEIIRRETNRARRFAA